MPIKKNIEYIVDEDGCWIITSHSIGMNKTFQVRIDGKRHRAHRYFYIQKYGEISEGLSIYHKCKNPSCCNPDHLTTSIFEKSIFTKEKEVIYVVQDNGCWHSAGKSKSTHGYPTIKRNKKVYLLSRYMYENYKEKIPDGMIIRHKCDNRLCINPDHLEIGTHADNVRDRVERNRSAIGTQNGRAKLTEDDVRYIRQNNTLTNTELSRMFSVDASVIRDVKKFKTWKHVK